MLKIKLNKELYELPLDESYKEKLNVSKDIIFVDDLSDTKAYKLLNKVFLYASQAMIDLEANYCPLELQSKRNSLFGNFMPIWEEQKQKAQQGFYSDSNKLLKELLTLMLKHYEKYMQMTQKNITR